MPRHPQVPLLDPLAVVGRTERRYNLHRLARSLVMLLQPDLRKLDRFGWRLSPLRQKAIWVEHFVGKMRVGDDRVAPAPGRRHCIPHTSGTSVLDSPHGIPDGDDRRGELTTVGSRAQQTDVVVVVFVADIPDRGVQLVRSKGDSREMRNSILRFRNYNHLSKSECTILKFITLD